MLLSNYSVLNRNCNALTGNAFTNPLAQFKATAFNAFYLGDHVVTDLTNRSAFADGYTIADSGGFAWWLAPKPGGMSSRTIVGDGTITPPSGALGVGIDADLSGVGDIVNALGQLIVSAVAALTGSGEITAAVLQSILPAVAALTGSGEIDATIRALAEITAALSGTGAPEGTITAKGTLASEITVTGDLLSTANVADAIWSAICEAGYSFQDVMRLLASTSFNNSTGGPGNPAFRDIANTKNRVVGTADADGNRTVTSLDPS